ncbi:hypothetical protein KM043_002045 [Ampulex compressa]|nr:hypothetical protein KM043_002045 [Ampulex compressa]
MRGKKEENRFDRFDGPNVNPMVLHRFGQYDRRIYERNTRAAFHRSESAYPEPRETLRNAPALSAMNRGNGAAGQRGDGVTNRRRSEDRPRASRGKGYGDGYARRQPEEEGCGREDRREQLTRIPDLEATAANIGPGSRLVGKEAAREPSGKIAARNGPLEDGVLSTTSAPPSSEPLSRGNAYRDDARLLIIGRPRNKPENGYRSSWPAALAGSVLSKPRVAVERAAVSKPGTGTYVRQDPGDPISQDPVPRAKAGRVPAYLPGYTGATLLENRNAVDVPKRRRFLGRTSRGRRDIPDPPSKGPEGLRERIRAAVRDGKNARSVLRDEDCSANVPSFEKDDGTAKPAKASKLRARNRSFPSSNGQVCASTDTPARIIVRRRGASFSDERFVARERAKGPKGCGRRREATKEHRGAEHKTEVQSERKRDRVRVRTHVTVVGGCETEQWRRDANRVEHGRRYLLLRTLLLRSREGSINPPAMHQKVALSCALLALGTIFAVTSCVAFAAPQRNYWSQLEEDDPETFLELIAQLRHTIMRNPELENNKRGFDLGLHRGLSGSQAAKHLMGLATANYAGGPGRRRRSEQA